MQGTVTTPKEICYWFLKQLYIKKAGPEDFINLRVIHNCTPFFDAQTGRKVENSECLYDRNIPVKLFRQLFLEGGLYEKLRDFNLNPEKPANIYFGINPRNDPRGGKKEHVPDFVAYYLDLDDNKGYSKEDRAKQITFWTEAGFAPSLVLDSGHGYHVYWILLRKVAAKLGEVVLKRMVAITGCKCKGNTFDVTRVFRLPTFKNQKFWFKHEDVHCNIVIPSHDQIADLVLKDAQVKQYDPDLFKAFPPSETTDIEDYVSKAQELGGNFVENLTALVQQTGAELKAKVQSSAQELAQSAMTKAVSAKADAEREGFTPDITSVPPDIKDIPWPHGQKSWMLLYCRKGFDGLTQGELQNIKNKIGIEDVSASELDFRIVYHLVKAGYTFEAISTLWSRSDLRLFRPDKEKKNANYLGMTYDKALQTVRDAIRHKDPLALANDVLQGNKVFVQQYFMMFKKGERISEIMHGTPELKGIYNDLDADTPSKREYYDLNIRVPKNGTADESFVRNMTIPRNAFNSCSEFKQYCSGTIALLTDKHSDLQRLALHLTSQDPSIPSKDFHSKLNYKNNKWIFPCLIIGKDKFTKNNVFETVPALKARFPLHEHFVKDVVPIRDVKNLIAKSWHDVLHLHLPRLTMSVLGVQAASALRVMFKEAGLSKTMHVPTVNVRGASCTGKTETVKTLYRLACVVHSDAVISTQTSEFALNRMVEFSCFVPLVIDEFKEQEANDKDCARVRSLVRRAFTGELLMRGRADLSVVSYRLHGALIVVGESVVEREGDIASITRVLPIDTDEFGPQMDIERFARVQQANLETIGPYFYQFLLQQNVQQMYSEYTNLRLDILKKIAANFDFEIARVASNMAAIIYGCQTWDKFIKKISPGTATFDSEFSIDKELIEYICKWSREERHSLSFEVPGKDATSITLANGQVIQSPAAAAETKSVSRNELMKFLEDISFMIQNRDPSIMALVNRSIDFVLIDEKRDEIAINIKNCLSVHNEYSVRNRYLGVQPSKINALVRAAIKNEVPYIIEGYKQIRTFNSRNRYTLFRLSHLRQMGIWHSQMAIDDQLRKTGYDGQVTD